MNRRDFLKSIGLGVVVAAVPKLAFAIPELENIWFIENVNYDRDTLLALRIDGRRYAFQWETQVNNDECIEWAKEALLEQHYR